MKFWTTFRFELTYQVRRVSTWLYFVALVFFALAQTSGNFIDDARRGGFFLSSPLIIAYVTVIGCLAWLVVAAYVTGDLAARDTETGMDPLTYTTPVSKAAYLGGRFFAAFVLNALLLLALPAGILLGLYGPEVEAEIRGPFLPAAYLTAYALIALPNAFVTTAIQFSFAALSRRAITSFLGGLVLLFAATGWVFLAEDFGWWSVARLMDTSGLVIVGELSMAWTPIQKNTLLIGLDGALLTNRLLWLGIALGALAFTHFRFHFRHHITTLWWDRLTRRKVIHSLTPDARGTPESTPISVPQVQRALGFATHVRQTLAIAWASFSDITKSLGGFLLLMVVGFFALLSLQPSFMGVPLLPRADYVLYGLTFPGVPPAYLIIPLLIVFCSGRLAWREREAGLSEMLDATPMPDWVLFLGKFLGLGLVLVLCMVLRMTAGLVAQVSMAYYDFEIALYLKILFGIQLTGYLLLALPALFVHVVVNHKQVGHLLVVLTMVAIIAARGNGIGHEMLVYGSNPGWSYTDMAGFGSSLGPWLWFNFYWAAWALLLGVLATLLWVRGMERRAVQRLRIARSRLTRPMTGFAAMTGGLILISGAFIFYNTNVLNKHTTPAEIIDRRAEYERRYEKYEGIPQPRLAAVSLNIEMYPERRAAEINGIYGLVNSTLKSIDSVHLATHVTPERVDFDRPAAPILEDDELGHRIYVLSEPLQPGDSLQLAFDMTIESRGFSSSGVDVSVVPNGTYFTSVEWLPALGYQLRRELNNPWERQAHGLAPRPAIPLLESAEARTDALMSQYGEIGVAQAGRIDFEAVMSTSDDQIAVAPGALRRTWTEDGRRYFHYTTDTPIGNEYALYSANYIAHEAQWNDVTIQIFHHPGHTTNLDRMVRSVQAALSHYTEQFGAYPYKHIKIVEHPGLGMGMHAEATTIDHEEGFSLLNPRDGPQGIDLPFYVVAHEVAHQWWGSQLTLTRPLEGNGLLTESLASYSAYQVVEKTYGADHLRRILSRLRVAYQVPRSRAAVPLLRANNAFFAYRKGPFAMYALSKYIGQDRVNGALRRMLEQHHAGAPPLLTSLDLHRHLQTITPDTLQYLLQDFFEANTFWQLATRRATAKRTDEGMWQVTLDVQASKVVVDTAGVETNVPMDDWVEIGVFAHAAEGKTLGTPLYLQMHRVRSGEQSITVMVPHEPARAGIDPYLLLIDLETSDNIEEVKIAGENDALSSSESPA